MKELETVKKDLSENNRKMVREFGGYRMKWESKELEEMHEFKYLDFNLDKKGDYKRYIKEINRKGKKMG